MPYLQLDTPFSHPVEVKQRLAHRLGEIYSRVMNADINRVTIAVRELGKAASGAAGRGSPVPPRS